MRTLGAGSLCFDWLGKLWQKQHPVYYGDSQIFRIADIGLDKQVLGALCPLGATDIWYWVFQNVVMLVI